MTCILSPVIVYTEKTMFCDGEGFSKFFTDDMGNCCCFFFIIRLGIPYYFQAACSLIGLKSVLTNQCDEFWSLETCENRF